jgi:hypothetical protein
MNNEFENLLAISRSFNSDTATVDNFISPSEVDDCIRIYNSLPVFAPATHNRATRKDYLMMDADNAIMRDLFYPKLQKLFPDEELIIDGGNFTTWHTPVNPHTDGYQLEYKSIDDIVHEKSVLGYAVLVPLSTDTGKGLPHTVFFNQKLYGKSIVWNQTVDFEQVDNFTDTPFDKNHLEYEKLNHLPDALLHGLTIEKVLPWNPGCAIIWHRSRVHGSTKFVDFNNKLHLIFFLSFKR